MLFNAPSELGRGAFTPENFPLQNNGYTRVITFSPLLSLPREKYTETAERTKKRELALRRLYRIRNWRCYNGHAPLSRTRHEQTSILVSFGTPKLCSRETMKHDLPRNPPPRDISSFAVIFPSRAVALGCDRS